MFDIKQRESVSGAAATQIVTTQRPPSRGTTSRRLFFPWASLVLFCACSTPQSLPAREGRPSNIFPAHRILLLHHSTGGNIFRAGVPQWFEQYNRTHQTEYSIEEREYPQEEPYGWSNYPYDYWNIWVKHAGLRPFKKEQTLELLTKDYGLIIFKHCYPVSNILEDTGQPDISSKDKRRENYMLQYLALRDKMRQFPKQRFLVWTGAALVKANTDEQKATRAKAFFAWVRDEWDEPGDNIFVWDLFELQTEGGLYFKDKLAVSANDSHPNPSFSARMVPLLGQRIVAILAGKGDSTSKTGVVH